MGSVHGVRYWLLIAHSHTLQNVQAAGLQIDLCIDLIKVQNSAIVALPGPSRHDGFQIIGDISTLHVLSQVKLMLNQSYIYSRLKIPLYIPGSIKTHRIYTRDFIYPAYYYEALWHDSSLLKRFNSNNEYALYLTRFTYDIMFGCYKQKQRYVFWYEKWQKNIFQWGNPGDRLSECVDGVEIYKIN